MSSPTSKANDDRYRVLITEQELLCKNQCGFYGTPQWNGLCSQCWRAHQIEQKRAQDFNKNRSILTTEERRLSVDPKNVVRSVIKKSPSVFSSSPLTPASESQAVEFHFTRSSSPDSVEADSQLHEYIYKNFSTSHARDLERSCELLIEKLYKNRQSSMDDLSLIVQDFYTAISDRAVRLGPVKQDFTTTDFLEHVESFLCVRAHEILFCTRSDEEILDISLQSRIRSLYWVTQGFLPTALDFESDTVEDLLNDAMIEITDMNSHKKIKEKFDCLLRCSAKIFEAIRVSTNAPANGDEFLSALIIIILKSNPTLLQSNMSFIQRFSLTSRTCRGETGYQFTTLSCAVKFIQDMSAENLRMPKEEFEAYTSGAQPAPNKIRSRVSATKALENSLWKMEEVNEAQANLKTQAGQLSDSIEIRFSKLHTQLDKLKDAPDLVLPAELDTNKLIQMINSATTTVPSQENKEESTLTTVDLVRDTE